VKLITDIALLRRPCQKVSVANGLQTGKKLFSFIDYYNRTEHDKAIGLAAPQLGILQEIAVINYKKTRLVLVNPRIVEHSQVKFGATERCLSLPGQKVNTFRYSWVRISCDNWPLARVFGSLAEDGSPVLMSEDDRTLCVALQHEISHLSEDVNKRLIIDFTEENEVAN